MKKVGAILAAVAMVVVAFVIRGGDDGSEDEGGGGGDAEDVTRLICPTEFEDICAETDMTADIQTAGRTADDMLAATRSDDILDGQAWVVPAAWAELVVSTREFEDRAPLFEASEPIASTRTALAIFEESRDSLSCDVVDWTCLVDAVNARFQVGNPPIDSALGLPVAAAQQVQLLGTSDFDRSRIQSSPFTFESGPYDTMRSRGPGKFAAAATTVAQSTGRTNSSLGVVSVDPQPTDVRIDLVIVTREGASLSGDTRDAIAQAFLAANWEPPGSGPSGLPSGDLLNVIREKNS